MKRAGEDGHMKKRIAIVLTCLALCCTACGKETEQVTGYGGQGTTAESKTTSADTENSEKTTVDATTEAMRVGHKLSDWLGGKELNWQETFSIGSYSVEANLSYRFVDTEEEREECLEKGFIPAYDTEELPAYRVTSITKDKVFEAEVVKNLLGADAKEVQGQIGRLNGDSGMVVDAVTDFYYRYNENAVVNHEDKQVTFPAWEDGEDYFWHTYEGKYMDIDYQLMIAYSEEAHQKVISFFPKNPGLLTGEPDLSEITMAQQGMIVPMILEAELENEDDEVWRKVSLEELGLTENRTKANEETMQKEAETFLRDQLLCKLNYGGVSMKDSAELVFCKGTDTMKDLEGAVLDGYAGYINCEFGKQDVFVESDFNSNLGSVIMTDKGVVGIAAYIVYDFEERLSDQVAILPFDKVCAALEQELADNMDFTKATSSTLYLNGVRFEYYPIPSPENSREYTFVPAWIFEIDTGNGYYGLGQAILNATDGNLIKIIYYE